MEDLRARTTLFCGVLAFAIALSMLLRGRRAVHWLFAAFAMDVAFWYASQSLYGIFQAPIWVRATAVLTVLLPQFAVHLFQSIVPLEGGERRSGLTRVATFLGIPMFAIALSPYHEGRSSLGAVYFYVFGLLAAALIELWRRGRKNPSRAVRDRVPLPRRRRRALDDVLPRRLPLLPRRVSPADRRRPRDRLPLRPRRVAHATRLADL